MNQCLVMSTELITWLTFDRISFNITHQSFMARQKTYGKFTILVLFPFMEGPVILELVYPIAFIKPNNEKKDMVLVNIRQELSRITCA